MSRQDEVKKLVDKQDKAVDKKLFAFYKKKLRELKRKTKKYVDEFEGLSVSQQLDAKRTLKMASEIDEILRDLNNESQTTIYDFLEEKATDGYLGTLYDVEGKAKIVLDFQMIDERYIDTLVNKKISGRTFSQRLYSNRTKLADIVKANLLDGAINGEGYRKIAKNIEEQTEADYKQSLRIARTEGGRVQTESTQTAYKEAEDLGINLQKKWQASLDGSTRDSHADLDGQVVDIDEEFEGDGGTAMGPGMFGDPAEDINCRCTTITIVEGISPKLRRDNETREVIEYKTYNEWKKDKI